MHSFNYHRPQTLEEVNHILGSTTEATLLAGGQSLIPTLKQRLAEPSDLIDLGGIDGLRGIRVEGDTVHIGAMTRHAEVAGSTELARAIPALSDMANHVGDHQVRNLGTLGGSLANNDPAADYPAAVLALDARVTTHQREITADDFFTGMFETALQPAEIITTVAFPVPQRAAYIKFRHPASRYALVGVMVAQHADGVRVAVVGAGLCVFRVPQMEAALQADFSADAIKDIAVDADELNADMHASAEYRAHLVNVMARRAVARALA